MEEVKEPVQNEHTTPIDWSKKVEMFKWRVKYSKYMDTNYWEQNTICTFTLVLQHCTPKLEEKIDRIDGWRKIKTDKDVIKLLIMM